MAETKVNTVDAQSSAPEVVPRAQYDALLAQAQNTINEATAALATAEADKKLLQDTLKTINKLVSKLFGETK